MKAGYVRHIGLSEVGTDTIRRAASVHPIAEYALIARSIEDAILPSLREFGIGVTAFGGHLQVIAGAADFRAHSQRFQGANLDANLALLEALRRIAAANGVSVALLAIAWVALRGDDIIPLMGARRRDRLAEAAAALDVAPSAHAAPGERYPAAAMADLDSER